MSQVLDYSAGFPGAATIKSRGYAGAVRYIGLPWRLKCTTKTELEDFTREGLGMALVFESTAADWRGGEAQGIKSGRMARDHANAIGFSAARPVYMAIDQDVVNSGEFATMIDYLRGAGQSLGGAARTGVYGEADVINRARDAGVAHWFWQTAAWSRGRIAANLNLYQKIGYVNVGGIACDVNDVHALDWGQHNYKGDSVSAADVNEALTQTHYGALGNRNVIDALGELLSRVLNVTDQTLPDILKAANLGATRPVGTFTVDQVTALGDQITSSLVQSLGADVAGKVLAEASRRLAGE